MPRLLELLDDLVKSRLLRVWNVPGMASRFVSWPDSLPDDSPGVELLG